MKFDNAPLIELVAEFRWLPTSALGEPVLQQNVLGVNSPKADAFYDRLRTTLASSGYNSAERLVPQGFPFPLYEPIFRYRRSSAEPTEIFQAGTGVFSVHALPPYQNWDHFVPVIKTGLDHLIAARNDTVEFPTAFTRVSLRYINAFQPELMQGRSAHAFFQDTLGFKVELPAGVQELVRPNPAPELTINFKAELGDGLNLNLASGKNIKYPDSLILDIAVYTEQQLPWAADEPMKALSKAHTAIRQAFMGMTESIHEIMKRRTEV